MNEELEKRQSLSFLEAEGLAPLPSQMSRYEIPKKFRIHLHSIISSYIYDNEAYRSTSLLESAENFFIVDFLNRQEKYRDEFRNNSGFLNDHYTYFIKNAPGDKVLDFCQFFCRNAKGADNYIKIIIELCELCLLGYRFIEKPIPTLIPFSSDEQIKTTRGGMGVVSASEHEGATKHLVHAASFLSEGRYSDSVRESIHAVESIAKNIAGESATLGKAIKMIDPPLHPALKDSLLKLYGWTSDESGIRHALISPEEKVSEKLALFIYSTCVNFCAFLTEANNEPTRR